MLNQVFFNPDFEISWATSASVEEAESVLAALGIRETVGQGAKAGVLMGDLVRGGLWFPLPCPVFPAGHATGV